MTSDIQVCTDQEKVEHLLNKIFASWVFLQYKFLKMNLHIHCSKWAENQHIDAKMRNSNSWWSLFALVYSLFFLFLFFLFFLFFYQSTFWLTQYGQNGCVSLAVAHSRKVSVLHTNLKWPTIGDAVVEVMVLNHGSDILLAACDTCLWVWAPVVFLQFLPPCVSYFTFCMNVHVKVNYSCEHKIQWLAF